MKKHLKPLADRLASRFPDASRRIVDDLATFARYCAPPECIYLRRELIDGKLKEAGHSVVIDSAQTWLLNCVKDSDWKGVGKAAPENFKPRTLGAGTRHFVTGGSLSWDWPPPEGYMYELSPLVATTGVLVFSHEALRDVKRASRPVRYASLSFADYLDSEGGPQPDIERILIVAPGLEALVEQHRLVERLAHSIGTIRAQSTKPSGRPRVAYIAEHTSLDEVEAALTVMPEDTSSQTDDSTVLIWSRVDEKETLKLLAQWKALPGKQKSTQHIHRIVYITRSPHDRLSDDVRAVLDPQLFATTKSDGTPEFSFDPLFAAIIPTVIVGASDRRVLPTRTLTVHDQDTLQTDESGKHRRGGHDFFDRDDYRTMRDTSVLTMRAIENNDVREFDRWARNLFCCRVGLALSGGGACAFRAVPLINHLQSEVGIDVLSGVSGGALIGAYFVGDEDDELQTALANGGRFMRTLPLALVSTEAVERVVDEDLGYQRIGQTSIRYLPVSTEMRPDNTPRGVVLVEGTLGQGVRVSGALPGLFAPTTIEGRRYTDGGGASLVPASYLSCLGADITLACNCIPGPAHSNLLRLGERGSLKHRIGSVVYALCGRGSDAVTWANFAMQKASAEFGRHADVFMEFEPSGIALLESGDWSSSHEIARRGLRERKKIEDAVARMRAIWTNLL